MLLERKYDGHQRAAQLAGRVGNSKQPTCAPSGYESKSGNPYWKGVPTPITARHRTVQLLNAGHSFAQIGRERGACNRNLASKISADLAAAGVGADPWQVIVPGAHARPKYATRKIQPDVAVFLRLVFSCNPQVTNKTLRLYAGLYMGVIVSTDAIATMLTENRIFRKRVAKMHRFVFRECNLQWARQFRLFRQGILADDCVFIDEWGANRFIMSNYGRAPGSQRAVGQQNELLNAHRTTFLTAMTSTEVLADATLAVEYPDTVKGLTIEEWLLYDTLCILKQLPHNTATHRTLSCIYAVRMSTATI